MNQGINKLNNFPSPNKEIFLKFIAGINNLGWWVTTTSGYRSYDEQKRLWLANKKNAKPGNSPHNHYRAIDINPVNKKTRKQLYKKSAKQDWLDSGIPQLANSLGLKWGDFANYVDRVHFEIPRNGKVEEIKYNENSDEVSSKSKIYKGLDIWNINIGEKAIQNVVDEKELEKIDEYVTKVSEIQKHKANGIWQIIKLVADQYSLSQNINDATIAFNQGSLLNFLQKVVQKPWLEFWGETVGDQYYFIVRKEPFDSIGWNNLPIIKNIYEDDILSDELSWYQGDIYSWYQIIPRGSFLGEQNLIFAYVTAVYFEEYAEIFGSKPNIQVSNYVNFVKIDEDNKMFSKALDDLRYMVESNAYLPFTRQGTITIKIDTTIKRGYRIFYHPTGEFFYVDAVSHSYNISDGGVDGTTTLKVSRGVVARYMQDYFNIISFDNPPPIKQEYEEQIFDDIAVFYFDNGRPYLIDIDETFSNNNRTDKKMNEQIKQFPNLRNDLNNRNKKSIESVADYLNRHKEQKFIVLGAIDEDGGKSFQRLAQQRANTVKNLVISKYLEKYNDLTRSELIEKIQAEGYTGADFKIDESKINKDLASEQLVQLGEEDAVNVVSSDLREKAYKRTAAFRVIDYKQKKEREVQQKGVNWKVNRKIFNFFLNRKQNISDSI